MAGSSKAEERRQRRGERRREAILLSAAQAFAAKGYHNATTREIAAAADLAEGTIFNYFPTKHDLLIAVFEQGFDRLRETALGRLSPALPPRQALSEALEAVLAFYGENRLFIRAALAETWTDPDLLQTHALPRLQQLAGSLEAYLQAQIAAARLRPLDTALAVRLVLGMIAALVLPIVRGVQPAPDPEERRRLAENVIDLLLSGIGAPT